jgi:hypothetical protein
MVPSEPFEILFLIYLGFTCLLGGFSGAITSRVLRTRWKPVVFLQDMAISGVASLLYAIVVTEIEWKRMSPIERGEVHDSSLTLVFVGLATPVVRHLIQFTSLRARSPISRSQ